MFFSFHHPVPVYYVRIHPTDHKGRNSRGMIEIITTMFSLARSFQEGCEKHPSDYNQADNQRNIYTIMKRLGRTLHKNTFIIIELLAFFGLLNGFVFDWGGQNHRLTFPVKYLRSHTLRYNFCYILSMMSRETLS